MADKYQVYPVEDPAGFLRDYPVKYFAPVNYYVLVSYMSLSRDSRLILIKESILDADMNQ
jgi:hypothetical protein